MSETLKELEERNRIEKIEDEMLSRKQEQIIRARMVKAEGKDWVHKIGSSAGNAIKDAIVYLRDHRLRY